MGTKGPSVLQQVKFAIDDRRAFVVALIAVMFAVFGDRGGMTEPQVAESVAVLIAYIMGNAYVEGQKK